MRDNDFICGQSKYLEVLNNKLIITIFRQVLELIC